jgi:hypothetical protein
MVKKVKSQNGKRVICLVKSGIICLVKSGIYMVTGTYMQNNRNIHGKINHGKMNNVVK